MMLGTLSALTCCAAAWQLPPPLPPSSLQLASISRSSCRSTRMMADAFVLDRLAQIQDSFRELTAKLEDPDIMADTDQLLSTNKERSRLEPTVDAYEQYLSMTQALEEAKELFAEADDVEMREMAREEQKELEASLAELDERLKLLLLPSDPNDDKNVMFEIRAGTGGDEAAIWASDLLKLYTKYAHALGMHCHLKPKIGWLSLPPNGAAAHQIQNRAALCICPLSDS